VDKETQYWHDSLAFALALMESHKEDKTMYAIYELHAKRIEGEARAWAEREGVAV
jgi:hypothetical protein